jgi:hypothetical protein
MPGLLGGVARVAIASGTATAVRNRVTRRQAERWAADDQGYAQPQYMESAPAVAPVQAAPAAAPAAGDPIEQLERLGELRDKGVLTDAEFEAQKAKLLG